MSPPGVGGGDVGGATLGGAAPLDEASSSVGILLRLQGGGGEDVGGQPPELIGPGLVPVLFQLQTDQSERRKEERLMSGKQLFVKNKCFIKCFPTATSQHSDWTSCPRLLPLPDQTLDRRELIGALSHLKPAADWSKVVRGGAQGEKLRERWCKSGTLSTVTASYQKVNRQFNRLLAEWVARLVRLASL